jgi:hypothetical protein
MGCIYACMCSGLCISCRDYQSEKYFGHAEDLAAQARGFNSMDDEIDYYNEINN